MPKSDFSKIEQGMYEKQLEDLRQRSPKTSPEEIYLLLNPQRIETAAEAYLARGTYTLEGWRNGLILLPLLLTWLSLGSAVLAYMQTYTIKPDEPFLKRWAEGFPEAPWPVISLVHTAWGGALLIGMLFVLTIVAGIIEHQARVRAAKVRSWLDNELYMLASASMVKSLGDGPQDKQPAWAVEVHTAI